MVTMFMKHFPYWGNTSLRIEYQGVNGTPGPLLKVRRNEV